MRAPPASSTVVLVFTVVVLNVADVYGTLWHVGHGAFELNPLMRWFLTFGPIVFHVLKFMLVAVGVGVALMFSTSRRAADICLAVMAGPLFIIDVLHVVGIWTFR